MPARATPPTRSTAGSPERSALAALDHGVVSDGGEGPARPTGGGLAGLEPRHVGRARPAWPPRRGARRRPGHGVDGIGGQCVGAHRGPVPSRHRPGQALDVRRQGRVVARWVVAWSPTTFTIGVRARRALWRLAMPLPSPGPRCSSVAAGRSGHAAVAVGGAGDDPFEEPEDGPHLGNVVEGGHEVHLRGAGVGETDVHPAADEGPDECLGAVHVVQLTSQSRRLPGPRIPCGSKARLIRPHERQLDRVLELQEVLLLLRADAVLARDGAAQSHAGPEDLARRTSVRASGSGWNTDRCTLPSPTCPHPVMRAPCACGDGGHRHHVLRDGGSGHHHVDDVVRPRRLGHEERLLPGTDQLVRPPGPAARRPPWHPSSTSSSPSEAMSSSSRASWVLSSTITR